MAAVQELIDCMISSWYPRFQRVSFKTIVLPLPQSVLDWLVSDGFHLPADSKAFAERGEQDAFATEEDYQDWQSEDGDEASEASAAQPPPAELSELTQRMQEAIDELGGRVVPKLSWSCPKDAVWMSPSSSLCCTNPDEVLLLLKSSDRVAHDICHALQDAVAAAAEAAAAEAAAAEAAAAEAAAAEAAAAEAAAAGTGAPGSSTCPAAAEAQSSSPPAPAAAAALPAGGQVQHCLALRRWHDLQPGREFRCFVWGQQLAGISQRDMTQCFEFLKEEQAELAEAIQAFHAKHVQGRFPHPHYTYDVYVATSGAVKLLDFNPVGGTTAPLLFSWEELQLAAAGSGSGSGSGSKAAGNDDPAAAAGAAAAGQQQQGEQGGGGGGSSSGGAGQSCACHQQQAAAAAGKEEQEAVSESDAAGPSAYLEQLRRVQALNLGKQPEPAAAAAKAAPTTAAPPPAAAPPAAGAAEGEPGVQPAVELRIIEEAVAMRPHTLAYGVPFDFVDSSEGSALDRLMQQAQQAGAAELWEALQQQSSSGRQ